MRKMRPRLSRQQWAELIKQQSTSEQNIKSFCEANDVGQASFDKWKRRLLDEDLQKEPPTSDAFKPMQLVAAEQSGVAVTPDTTITLSLGANITLKIQSSGAGA